MSTPGSRRQLHFPVAFFVIVSIAKSSRSFARSITHTGRFFRQQVWLWPILAAVILALVGWLLRSLVETSVKQTMAENLRTILTADVAALSFWLQTQKDNADAIADDPKVRAPISVLTTAADDSATSSAKLAEMPEQQALLAEIQPWLDAHDYAGYAVVNQVGRIVAANHNDMIGRDDLPIPDGLIQRIFAGETVVTPPFKSAVRLPDEEGEMKSDLPTMFTVAPVRNDADEVVALLGLRIRPQAQFTEILRIARPGKSGETYAFNDQSVLVSGSRFDDELKRIRLLDEDEESILNIQVRDPQVNMLHGRQPELLTSEQPYTLMVQSALSGEADLDLEADDFNVRHNVDGYRDYRGVPVIGAWIWLPDFKIGVASEVDVAEAYQPLYILRWAFWGLFALLACSSVAIFVYTLVVARLQKKAQQAALEAKELGQYTLEEKIGEGGMGVVYRGHHAMLRRPTAVKLLDPEKTNESAAARFEREVQMTAQLNHPNTIAIFDYGRTPEGVFYYAMEFLDGFDLQQLVERHGPQPPGRVVHLLRQVCGSLNEAHGIGLIHRDIKPANMILSVRGGVYDFLKLLDFGLVKAVDGKKQATLTAAGSFTGTPLYLSPEGIETPDKADARSDIYAVGAVGYYLLTGKPLFDSTSIVEICMNQVSTMPEMPSQRLGQPVDSDLEAVIMQCLAKDPADRPAGAKELAAALAACACASQWTDADAEKWWREDYSAPAPRGDRDKEGATDDVDATIEVDKSATVASQSKPQ